MIALFVALGGVSYGLAGRNTVASDDIINGAVKSADIKNRGVKSKDIRVGGVKANNVAKDSLGGAEIIESTLGKVPNANNADKADNADNADQAANSSQLGGLGADSYQRRVRWALVAADGTIVAQSGGISLVDASASGNYYLDFGEPVTGKLIHVSGSSLTGGTGNQGASPCGAPSTLGDAVGCGPGGNSPNVLFVFTYAESGGGETLTDRSFYVSVSE